MPGIFGLVDKVGASNRIGGAFHSQSIATMAEVMRYESYYTSAQYDYEALGVYVGWVGPTESGPIVDRQNGLSLFLSGVAYCETAGNEENDLALNQERKQGYRILRHYARIGDRFPEKISGLCSGFLVDEKLQNSFLFNDRFGVERLFLYEDDERVVFASEAKAILSIIPETRDFDPVGLGEFLACGCTLGENSLFRKIRVMPGGSVLKIARGRPPRASKYLDRSSLEGLDPLEEECFLERFCETLKNIARKYLQAPRRAAVSLTGGLDSRMIMACLDAPDGTAPCYTFGSMYRETYDVLIARKVARHCNQPHQVLVLGADFLAGFQDYLNKAVFISDGYLGFSGAAELYLNTLARAVSPVRITGNYGGELLRGVRAFKSSIPRGGFLRPELLACVRETARVFSQRRKMNPTSFTLFIQAPSGYGRYAIERSQVAVVTPFLDVNMVELIYRRPPTFGADKDPSFAVINNSCKALMAIPTDRGLLGRDSWMARAARRFYREAMFKLEYLTGHGMPDSLVWASRFGMDRVFERVFTGRHKFQHFRTWVQKELSNSIWAVLDTDNHTNLDKYIDFKRFKQMLVEHQDGKRNFTEEIDNIMTIVLADRLLLRNEQNAKSTWR